MKNFVKGMITNRFGIILATLNVCYLVSVDFTKNNFPVSNFGKIVFALNFPAGILTGVSLKFVEFIFSLKHIFLYRPLLSFTLLFFVTFQWLFIAWLSRTIARKIQSVNS